MSGIFVLSFLRFVGVAVVSYEFERVDNTAGCGMERFAEMDDGITCLGKYRCEIG